MVKNNKQNLLAKLLSYFTALKITKQLLLKSLFGKLVKPGVFIITVAFLLISFSSAHAQYYYKDIWNNEQLSKEFSILKANNFRIIKVKSFEDDGQPSEEFFCEKKVNKNYTQSQMISRSYITGQSLLTTDYDMDGKVIKTNDETPTTTSATEYTYDAQGKLSIVQVVVRGDGDSTQIAETHEYFYNDSGLPAKMILKKNGTYISTINFIEDANGNITEEDPNGNEAFAGKYFYYYDDKSRLTDVVHFNERANRLLPDYMYEYTIAGQRRQMISTAEGGDNYFIWKYTYNDQGLRATEKCYSKERRLLGTIEYDYK